MLRPAGAYPLYTDSSSTDVAALRACFHWACSASIYTLLEIEVERDGVGGQALDIGCSGRGRARFEGVDEAVRETQFRGEFEIFQKLLEADAIFQRNVGAGGVGQALTDIFAAFAVGFNAQRGPTNEVHP
jgi:hypothetical protein